MNMFKWLLILFFLTGCTTLDIFEKTTTIPNQKWYSKDTCDVNFNVTDTSSYYKFYFVIRHHQQYPYKNIYVQINVTQPDTSFSFIREFELADNSKWLGSTIGDVVEHRLLFNNQLGKLKKGNYAFKISQIMREDPLPYVFNAGIRIQKEKN